MKGKIWKKINKVNEETWKYDNTIITFEKNDYNKIIDELITKYSGHKLFCNKRKVNNLIRKEPESTGWFSKGENIWNNCYDNITTPKKRKFSKEFDIVIDKDKEILFGIGDDKECILFIGNGGDCTYNHGVYIHSLNHVNIYKNRCQLEGRINCTDIGVDKDRLRLSYIQPFEDDSLIDFSPENSIILNVILDFLDLRLKQIKNKNKLYLETVNKSNKKLKDSKKSIKDEFDKDGNGIVDIIEGDDVFMKLFKQNQKKIIENDKSNIQKFVKVSNYLKIKRQNIQNIYIELMDYEIQEDLMKILTIDDLENILKNQIHSFESILFHSLNMINSLVEEDLITFYEIYESFDKLNMFNSNWENEVSDKLTNIGEGLEDLMFSIQKMEENIVSQLKTLTYVTDDGFSGLNKSLSTKLTDINSSLNLNNLLTGIQTYQMYKINNNTKSIN